MITDTLGNGIGKTPEEKSNDIYDLHLNTAGLSHNITQSLQTVKSLTCMRWRDM